MVKLHICAFWQCQKYVTWSRESFFYRAGLSAISLIRPMSKLRLWPSNLIWGVGPHFQGPQDWETLLVQRRPQQSQGYTSLTAGSNGTSGAVLLSLRRKCPLMHDTHSQYLARFCSLSLHRSERACAERKIVSTVFRLLPSVLSCISYLIASAVTCLCFPWKQCHQLFWRLSSTAGKNPNAPHFCF